MNLTRQPIFSKPEKVDPKARKPLPRRKPIKAKPKPRDPYLDAVCKLPCVICDNFGMVQNSPTEAHHWKSGRYGSRRTPCGQAIPLCHSHHNKLKPYPGDEDKIGFHNAQETWEALYGPDTQWILPTQDAVEAMKERDHG